MIRSLSSAASQPVVTDPRLIIAPFVLLLVCAAGIYALHPGAAMKLADVPPLVLLFGALAFATTSVCVGQWYVHHRFKYADFVQHNEVGGFIIAVAGSMYAVVLGFLTLVAWQHYFDARTLVSSEAAAAVDAWHVVVGLPERERVHVRQDILEYSNRMVHAEWQLMDNGKSDLRSGVIIMDAIARTEGLHPADFGQSNAQSATLAQLGIMHDDRQRRLADNASALTGFQWLVLLIGAVCVICFCWLFGLSNAKVHMLMTSAVTIIITTTLVMLFELQYPFRGGMGIAPADWMGAIDHIHWMMTSSPANMLM